MPSPKKPKGYRPLKDAPALAEADAPPPMGDNNPPPDKTPLEIMQEAVDDLYLEAQNWLDGDPISNEAQADALTELKGRLEEAVKTVEAERKALADPVYKEWKAINTAWKPVAEKAEKAVAVARRALTPWLQAVKAEQDRIAAEKRREAEEAAERLRQQAIAERQSSDLQDVDRREELEQEAKAANREARQAEKETAVVRTGSGKATLRTYWLVNVVEAHKLLAHYRQIDPEWLKKVLRERAEADVRGGVRHLPGCNIWDEQRAI